MGFVGPRRVAAAQPPVAIAGPFGEVIERRPGGGVLALSFPQVEEEVVQPGRQLLLGYGAGVGLDEAPVQESDDERCVVGGQKPPGRMALP